MALHHFPLFKMSFLKLALKLKLELWVWLRRFCHYFSTLSFQPIIYAHFLRKKWITCCCHKFHNTDNMYNVVHVCLNCFLRQMFLSSRTFQINRGAIYQEFCVPSSITTYYIMYHHIKELYIIKHIQTTAFTRPGQACSATSSGLSCHALLALLVFHEKRIFCIIMILGKMIFYLYSKALPGLWLWSIA